jgi:hypothetical protein
MKCDPSSSILSKALTLRFPNALSFQTETAALSGNDQTVRFKSVLSHDFIYASMHE